ncbi:unnamed protein product [Mytilus coruscus]|uniref:Uncharacterized protein n=1 Tax=Mytilus coruscus TaxID=42192 RepID=A0A6J8EBU6_MYTCO|nr:unnamed protein product [Mytilus coruscus]
MNRMKCLSLVIAVFSSLTSCQQIFNLKHECNSRGMSDVVKCNRLKSGKYVMYGNNVKHLTFKRVNSGVHLDLQYMQELKQIIVRIGFCPNFQGRKGEIEENGNNACDIAEISRQIQSLSESTIQHGPRGQGVRPKVVENKEHDSGVVTTGPSLSTPVGLAMGDTLPLPDRDIITNPQVNNRKSIGQDKIQNINPKQESKQNQSTAQTVSSGSNDVKIKPSKYDGLTPWMDYLSHFEMCALVNMWSEHQKVCTWPCH